MKEDTFALTLQFKLLNNTALNQMEQQHVMELAPRLMFSIWLKNYAMDWFRQPTEPSGITVWPLIDQRLGELVTEYTTTLRSYAAWLAQEHEQSLIETALLSLADDLARTVNEPDTQAIRQAILYTIRPLADAWALNLIG